MFISLFGILKLCTAHHAHAIVDFIPCQDFFSFQSPWHFIWSLIWDKYLLFDWVLTRFLISAETDLPFLKLIISRFCGYWKRSLYSIWRSDGHVLCLKAWKYCAFIVAYHSSCRIIERSMCAWACWSLISVWRLSLVRIVAFTPLLAGVIASLCIQVSFTNSALFVSLL